MRKPAQHPDERKRAESEFWDLQVAERTAAEPAKAGLETEPWEVQEPAYRFYLRALGDLKGKRVLDCGCGGGKLSVLLAAAGAAVCAVDISSVSVRACRSRAIAGGVAGSLVPMVADVEALPFVDNAFDVVCGVFVLHHVDVPLAGREVRRLLKPDGRAVFLENSAANAVLTFGRKHLVGRLNIPRIGSPDEHPLTESEVQSLRPLFGRVERRFPQMVFLRLILYRVVWAALPTERFPTGPLRHLGNWLWNLGPRLDDALYRFVPCSRKYSWWQVLAMTKPSHVSHEID